MEGSKENKGPDKTEKEKWIEKAPAILGACTTLLYVPGFIVVNAYMATKGVTEQPLLSSRYVAAGGLILAISVLFYFLVLKHVVRRAREGIKMDPTWPEWFKIYMHNYFVLDALFRSAYFAAWLIAITTPSAGSASALVLTTLAGVVDRWIFATKRLGIITRFSVSGVLLIAALVAFSVLGVFDSTLLAVSSAAALFLYATVTVFTSEGWRTGEDRTWGTVYLCIYALLATVAFGATAYGGISAKFGGGAPIKVQVILATTADDEIKRALGGAKDGLYMLASTEEALVLEIRQDTEHKRIVRIQRSQFTALFFDSVPAGDSFKELVDRLLTSLQRAEIPSRQAL